MESSSVNEKWWSTEKLRKTWSFGWIEKQSIWTLKGWVLFSLVHLPTWQRILGPDEHKYATSRGIAFPPRPLFSINAHSKNTNCGFEQAKVFRERNIQASSKKPSRNRLFIGDSSRKSDLLKISLFKFVSKAISLGMDAIWLLSSKSNIDSSWWIKSVEYKKCESKKCTHRSNNHPN